MGKRCSLSSCVCLAVCYVFDANAFVLCRRSTQPQHPCLRTRSQGSAGGNGISQGSFRRAKQEECLSILIVHFQFSAGLHPHRNSSILTVDPFNYRASLTCSCAQDFQTMKVSELKDLLRDSGEPVTYSFTLYVMTVVLGSV